jgi:poly(3-hydroxybutyrate) depolymerase
VSDELFTTDLVNSVKSTFCIDVSRVYAVGYSNGGGFVNTLACSAQHGGQFAAFASFAAALYTDVSGETNCSPARSPLPVFETHGSADGTIPYNGGTGRGGPLPAVPEWLGRWSARNKCTGSTTTDRGNGVTDQSWTCAGKAGLLRHIRMQGQGHGYPGPTNAQLFMTSAILNWLPAHTKP